MPEMGRQLLQLAERINKEVWERPIPVPSACLDLLDELKEQTSNISLTVLEETGIAKVLIKARKSFRRHKRSAMSSSSTHNGEGEEWDRAIEQSNELLNAWKKIANEEERTGIAKQKRERQTKALNGPVLPETAHEYRMRLVEQKKELYKDPPVLPPDVGQNQQIITDPMKAPLPKRNLKTGSLTFQATESNNASLQQQQMVKDFKPNVTPAEVLRAGSFGGTYFRPIVSAVTGISYSDPQLVMQETLAPEWIDGLDSKTMLTSKTYRAHVNKFGVKCGGSLGMWESSGWISSADPYGWFQWYCRFYQGRRCSDDARQISRWLKCAGPKGRFRSQLCNKILAAATSHGNRDHHDDATISPVIRQTLWHWGLEITNDIVQEHKKRVRR